MESKMNTPKYIIIDGALANAVTREYIPDDEPIFILRAKDRHAIKLLRQYMAMCSDINHRKAIYKCIKEFDEFALLNPEKMGEPDTDGNDQWPDHPG